MNEVLRKFHNLCRNCNSIEELYEHGFTLLYLNPEHKELITRLIDNANLACEHTSLPIYYFQASNYSNKLQDRFGNWYCK